MMPVGGVIMRRNAPKHHHKEFSMRIWKGMLGIALAAAMATAAYATTPQDAQNAKQDAKDAGHSAKDAARDAGHATKNSAKNAGHSTKRATKRAGHKAARKTRQGADKLEDKTRPQ
jgi:type II secretory pathway pseudopilin PulG